MRIFLHHLDGAQTVAEINENSTLENLLAQHDAAGCRAVYQGSHLATLDTLINNANVYLTADLDGGKKKKKKKAYTTKKKGKHIHKKVKMGIYSLYAVDGTYSITQERELLPSPEKLAHPADPAPSWVSIGTDTTADSATPPSRWTPKPSRRTNKS
jgi:small subunit ribosomal protein S27Ae